MKTQSVSFYIVQSLYNGSVSDSYFRMRAITEDGRCYFVGNHCIDNDVIKFSDEVEPSCFAITGSGEETNWIFETKKQVTEAMKIHDEQANFYAHYICDIELTDRELLEKFKNSGLK